MPVTYFALYLFAAFVVVVAAVWAFQALGVVVFTAGLCATAFFARWAMEPVQLEEQKVTSHS